VPDDLQLLVEYERRSKHNELAESICFPKQLEFIRNPARRKALFGARRFGKSYTLGAYLLQEALSYPRRSSIYVGLSSDAAYGIIFRDIIEEQCRKRNIRLKYNATTHVITFSNGHTIKLAGMESSPRDMEKLLGRKYHLAVIDECQSFTQDLRMLVTKKLWPAMQDYVIHGGGTVVLAGTPGDLRGRHYWYSITKQLTTGLPDPDREKGWHVTTWPVSDNPYMSEQFKLVQQDYLQTYGPSYVDLPAYRSEWLGQWIMDPGANVFKWDPKINTVTDPELAASLLRGDRKWTYIVSTDLGWEDATAIVLSAYAKDDPNWYVVKSEKFKHMFSSQLGAALSTYKKVFGVQRMVVDTGGGASKQLAMSLQSEFELPIFAADKAEKENAIARMNSDFLAGRIKVVTLGGVNEELVKEWERLTWNKKKLEEDGVLKFDEKFDDHCFVSGTPILTPGGWRPIEEVTPGDLVETRHGPRPVEAATPTRVVPIWRMETNSGCVLEGSADHGIPTANRGRVELCKLREGDVVWVSPEWQKRLSSTGSGTGDTRSRSAPEIENTSGGRLDDFSTATFGSSTTDQSRVVATSTTWTTIRGTTSSTISSVSQRESTCESTCALPKGENKAPKSCVNMRFQHVLRQEKTPSGELVNLQSSQSLNERRGSEGRSSNSNASGVGTNFKVSFLPPKSVAEGATQPNAALPEPTTKHGSAQCAEESSVSTDSSVRTFVLDSVRTIGEASRAELVYGLAVTDVHEYVAGGIVVFNCTMAALYGWRDSLHHHSMVPDLKPEAVDAAARMIRLKKQLRPIARDDEYDVFDRMDEEAEAREIVRKYRAGG
jgi:hypothetical protein